MKNRYVFLLPALLMAVLACSVLGTPAPDQPAVDVPTAASVVDPNQPLSQSLTMQSSPVSEAGEAPPYTINAQIPFLQGSDDVRVQNFNTYLKQVVTSEMDAFREGTIANASNPPIAAGSSFDLQYAVIGQRGEVWSVKYSISFYADGAAHPGHYSITINYDLANGREITLDELFISGSNYLQVISDACKAELSTRGIGFEGFSTGADPLPENFTNWNLSNEGLIITFDEYQVAPYAAGAQVVTIPFSALQSVINPDGVIVSFSQ